VPACRLVVHQDGTDRGPGRVQLSAVRRERPSGRTAKATLLARRPRRRRRRQRLPNGAHHSPSRLSHCLDPIANDFLGEYTPARPSRSGKPRKRLCMCHYNSNVKQHQKHTELRFAHLQQQHTHHHWPAIQY